MIMEEWPDLVNGHSLPSWLQISVGKESALANLPYFSMLTHRDSCQREYWLATSGHILKNMEFIPNIK